MGENMQLLSTKELPTGEWGKYKAKGKAKDKAAKCSGWKFKEKQNICMVSKSLSPNMLLVAERNVIRSVEESNRHHFKQSMNVNQ